MSLSIIIPLLTGLLGGIFGITAATIALRGEREKLRAEYAVEVSVEVAVKRFLSLDRLPYRSFPMIRHHIGGFEANELRRLLVRSGAVRFMAADKTELWALRERVSDDYQRGQWKHKDAPSGKVPNTKLFPAAFGNDVDL